MGLLWAIIKNILSKIIFWAVIAAVVFYGWNTFKRQRESRTFTVSFDNIEGLSRGAPIYAQGIKVGKVVDIFPLGNTNDVGVKGLITNKDFPTPKGAVRTKIVTNIESGGGQILEIEAVMEPLVAEYLNPTLEQLATGKVSKGQSPITVKHTYRLMRDFFQLTKDFAVGTLAALSSPKSQEYGEKLSNTVNNTITSLEYGTLKQDVKNNIEDLNKDIKNYERSPNKKAKTQKILADKAKALQNTVSSFGTLQGVYSSKQQKQK